MTLIERLEAATGPDRELDAEIFQYAGCPLPTKFASREISLEWSEDDKCFVMSVAGTDMRIRYEHPHFTSSIDAALTLVPEGWAWNVWRIGYEFLQGAADLWIPSKYSKGLPKERFRVEAKTAPLALCIAALRARGVILFADFS